MFVGDGWALWEAWKPRTGSETVAGAVSAELMRIADGKIISAQRVA
jgi:hypothetical protein